MGGGYRVAAGSRMELKEEEHNNEDEKELSGVQG